MQLELLGYPVAIALPIYGLYRGYKTRQLKFMEQFEFHPAIGRKVQERYPHLTNRDVDQVLKGLQNYFYICHQAGKRIVAMPSQAVDVAWHEFILFTRAYKQFCRKAQGRFLHHTPAEGMHTQILAQEGIKRAWRLACAKGNINPKKPNRLPLLFALDERLKIKGGFIYDITCGSAKSRADGNNGYCAGDIGCTGGCVGSSGAPGSGGNFFDSTGGDSGTCSGGCGGD
ncbi:hypothetical protein [uncultured Microbulbifer sp.]|uniref:glycine-rich domain-containing protein n=1 Tax=uncultured Microbulbifer sp. TaxID=348147 RepID=UPI00260919B5|nr:hypothetical protein [uncultured Microbulbifer sp.]